MTKRKIEKTTVVWKIIDNLRNSGYVKHIKYRQHYPKNEVVKVPNLGCFCFKTREQTRNYLKSSYKSSYNFQIIKVLGIGTPVKLPSKISFADTLIYFYIHKSKNNCSAYLQPVPKGTICFKSVIPLE